MKLPTAIGAYRRPYSGLVIVGGTNPPVTPAPSFTIQPSISPTTGSVGTVFSGSDGYVNNGSVSARQWFLNGSAISGANGASYTSTASGTLTYQVTATGAGGTTSATSVGVSVSSSSSGNAVTYLNDNVTYGGSQVTYG